MQALEREVKSCPAVLQYALAADGRHGAPEVAFVKRAIAEGEPADAIELVIVSGPLDQAAAQASAVRLAARHAGVGLRVAFCLREPDDSPGAALLGAFDAVFITSLGEAAPAVRRLARSLMVPADSSRWIGCEWGGLRDLVAGTRGRRAHYGFGTASRQDCAAEPAEAAYAAATAQLERQGGCLRDARAVCLALVTGAPDLAATDAMALVARLRCALGPGAAIFLSMGCDESLAAETLDVSLFTFGAPDTAEAVAAPLSAEQACASDSLYVQAHALVAREGRASVSLVQRHLHFGYQHAASLAAAIGDDPPAIRPPDGSPPRLAATTTIDRKENTCP